MMHEFVLKLYEQSYEINKKIIRIAKMFFFHIQVDLFKSHIGLDATHYSSFVECLQDYYAEVRLAACEALFLLGINLPNR